MNKITKIFYKKMILFTKVFGNNCYQNLWLKYIKSLGVEILGKPRFISDDIWLDPEGYSLIKIGDKATISKGVTILVHDYSATQGFYMHDKSVIGVRKLSPVSIGSGSFIGANTTILPGTTVGDNVIVGAGSLVTGVLEDNSVFAGNPARKIASIDQYINKAKTSWAKETITVWRE